MIEFSISPVKPFRLDLTAWALRRRASNAVDFWDGETYQRVLAVDGKPVLVAATQRGADPQVTIRGKKLPDTARPKATRALERLLGTRVDLSGFYEFASQKKALYELVDRFRA